MRGRIPNRPARYKEKRRQTAEFIPSRKADEDARVQLHDDRGMCGSGSGTNEPRGHWQIDPLQGTFKIAMERFPRR